MEKNTEFHTCKPRQERSFRVVLKHIHPSTDLNDIKQSLKDKGHDVTNIWNAKIYKINTLFNTVVQFEAPHAKREIPQCMRCQKFGHTKTIVEITEGA
jgi:hypothetical protein